MIKEKEMKVVLWYGVIEEVKLTNKERRYKQSRRRSKRFLLKQQQNKNGRNNKIRSKRSSKI